MYTKIDEKKKATKFFFFLEKYLKLKRQKLKKNKKTKINK